MERCTRATWKQDGNRRAQGGAVCKRGVVLYAPPSQWTMFRARVALDSAGEKIRAHSAYRGAERGRRGGGGGIQEQLARAAPASLQIGGRGILLFAQALPTMPPPPSTPCSLRRASCVGQGPPNGELMPPGCLIPPAREVLSWKRGHFCKLQQKTGCSRPG